MLDFYQNVQFSQWFPTPFKPIFKFSIFVILVSPPYALEPSVPTPPPPQKKQTTTIFNNTSLAAKGALVHHLRRRTVFKIQNGRQGAPKWPTEKVSTPRFLGVLSHFCKIRFFDQSTPSMRKVDDGEKKKKKEKENNDNLYYRTVKNYISLNACIWRYQNTFDPFDKPSWTLWNKSKSFFTI